MTADDLERHLQNTRENSCEQSKQQAADAAAVYVYERLSYFVSSNRDEDEGGDFFLWLYPRIKRLILSFNPSKASLSTYMTKYVQFYYRSFLRIRCAQAAHRNALEQEECVRVLSETDESHDASSALEFLRDPEETYGGKPDLSTREGQIYARKILLLACKSSLFIDDQAIRKVAYLTGCDEAWLMEKCDALRRHCKEKEERFKVERERMNGYYIRARRCELELRSLDRSSGRFAQLEKERSYCLLQWKRLESEQSRHIRAPSNRCLAAILGISRGTIDSTLAYTNKHAYSGAI